MKNMFEKVWSKMFPSKKEEEVFKSDQEEIIDLVKALRVAIDRENDIIADADQNYELFHSNTKDAINRCNEVVLEKAEGYETVGRTLGVLEDKIKDFHHDHLVVLQNSANTMSALEKRKDDLMQTLKKSFTTTSGESLLKFNKYMHHNIGRKRDTMPQISSKDIDKFLIHFSDKVKVVPVKVRLNSIKPSQSEFLEDKILDKTTDDHWKTRRYILSKDNYLIDGHHSWAAGLEMQEDYEVDAYRINLSIKDLLRRTNLMKISRKEDLEGNQSKFEKSMIYANVDESEASHLNDILDGCDNSIMNPLMSLVSPHLRKAHDDFNEGMNTSYSSSCRFNMDNDEKKSIISYIAIDN